MAPIRFGIALILPAAAGLKPKARNLKIDTRNDSPSPDAGGQPDSATAPSPALMITALGQSEQVLEKVEQCAADLSSVNGVLRKVIDGEDPLHHAGHAINLSEQVEATVVQCAGELASVNSALSEEIDERRNLDRALETSSAALAESQAEAAKALHLALHDPVTGLPNLPLFSDRLSQALAHARRYRRRVAVMFIDLDSFKEINDAHGHDVGDSVLKMVGRRLQAVVREGDTVSRRSGDEFLFLMLDAIDERTAVKLAAKVVGNIARPCEVQGITVTMHSSIGIALFPEHGQSAQELLKNADTAMYAAKQGGQGYAVFTTARP